MRAIERAAGELLGVLLGAVLAFFVGIATLASRVILGAFMVACFVATGGLIFMAMFCGAGWFFTHKAHELLNAAGFLAEAAIPFMAMVLVAFYREKAAGALAARRERKAALGRIAGVHFATDASYDP